MNSNIYKLGVAALIMSSSMAYAAPYETPDSLTASGYSPAALELLKDQRLWFYTTNAAGAELDNTLNYSEVLFEYDNERGDFHRPQQGQRDSHFGINCEGFMNLKSAYVWGNFSFNQRNIRDTQFNASIADPYRGMPFFYADENISNWNNQYYDMCFRVATPFYWNRIAFGAQGLYTAHLAAKQRDTRVDTRFFQLGINPGIVVKLNDHNAIGVDFQYTDIKEDSRMSTVNNDISQNLYFLNGLGVASFEVFNQSRTSDYYGHILGGGIQYNLQSALFNMMLAADYTRHVENMDLTPSTPEKKTSIEDDTWKANIDIQFQSSHRYANFINLSFTHRYIKGIQYISENNGDLTNPGFNVLDHSVRSNYKSIGAGIGYSFIRYRGIEYSWRLDANIDYSRQDDRYILPEAKKKSDALYMSVAPKYNIAIGKGYNRRLLLGAKAGLAVRYGEYSYSDMFPDYPTFSQLEASDIAYLGTSYYNVGATITYSQQFSTQNRMNMYVRAAANYIHPFEWEMGSRTSWNVAIGFTY